MNRFFTLHMICHILLISTCSYTCTQIRFPFPQRTACPFIFLFCNQTNEISYRLHDTECHQRLSNHTFIFCSVIKCDVGQPFLFKNYHKLPGCRKCRLLLCFSVFLLYVWMKMGRRHYQEIDSAGQRLSSARSRRIARALGALHLERAEEAVRVKEFRPHWFQCCIPIGLPQNSQMYHSINCLGSLCVCVSQSLLLSSGID